MARKPKRQPEAEQAAEAVAASIGGNVTQETLRQHYGAIDSAEGTLKRAQQKLKTCWDDAENAGIDKKALKQVMKRLREDPATARMHMQLIRSYSTQLGLFDKIEGWLQDEDKAANAASIEAASSGAPPAAQIVSGGSIEAARAQGFEAGVEGERRGANPYLHNGPQWNEWESGYSKGHKQRGEEIRTGTRDIDGNLVEDAAA